MSDRRPTLNEGFDYRETIGPHAAGRTALAYLSERYRHSTKGTWTGRIAGGEVLIDGETARVTDVLKPGQSLVWRRPPWEEPPAPLSYAVLHLDEHLLAVAKPRGLPTIPHGGLYLTHTLVHVVRQRWPEASPMHRLGRGTSGLLLLARTPEARRAVAEAWRAGRVEKAYRALVVGVPRQERFSVDDPIGPVPHPRLGEVHAVSDTGKASLSQVRRLEVRGGESLVEVEIPTGRPHQIRIHLAAAGHPLVGDPLYVEGGHPAPDAGLPGEGGFWLHSWRLRLDHPLTREPLEMHCGPPPPLRRRLAPR